MTMRTTSKLRCDCGHEGVLKTAENDAPYSAEWVLHSLVGFSGSVDNWKLDQVKCPSCLKVGKVRFADGQ